MQTNHFCHMKTYYIILITLYIGAFSLLLTGIHLLCKELQSMTSSTLQSEESPQQLQENIAKNIIRLHVIANSDTEADQRLKLLIRDEIISSLQNALRNADSPGQAMEIIASRTPQIKDSAYRILSRYNSSYSVNVTLQPRYFPVKQYGDLSFPAGTYQALCIEIGKAQGRNWWCVLFPSLCFVNETTATVPDESKEKLKERLSEEEYQTISNEQNNTDTDSRPELHFGIADWFRSVTE